ncbi:MAG: hypothetical protein LBG19_03205 [Prevotellaceae bacterium]|jgi:hypothetical protein|nr:hypothetical protein [Prevotellaceae bacterium]
MKKLIAILLLSVQCSSMNYTYRNIENRLLYGQNKGFVPQPVVFVQINDSIAFAEGFYPLKGMLFATFIDTLYYSKEKNIFSNEKSKFHLKNNQFYFERKDSLWAFRIEKTKLKYKQDNKEKYTSFKNKAVSYHSYWDIE